MVGATADNGAAASALLIAEGRWHEEPRKASDAVSRTLSVLFADLKDYTGQAALLSRQDLVNLLRRLRGIVEKAVAARGGKIVKTMGDGIVATFDSATNAVLAGADIQRTAAARNQQPDEKTKLELRIGVSTGEVTVEADDVYGPTVNVAARVQALCETGEVRFTEATRHAINPAEVTSEEIGVFDLKGVPEPTRLFRTIIPPAN